MIKLIVDKIEGFYYEVYDEQNRKYKFHITFYDMEENPKEGDIFFVHPKLLKEKNTMLSFGNLESKYGRKIKNMEDPDLLVLSSSKGNVYLKRLYG